MKHPLILLMAGLLMAQSAIADTPDKRLDSLVGTWKNLRPGAESIEVVIRKNLVGELVMQGDDSASSYTLTCRPKSGSVSCAGSGKMRADGQDFIYRNTIKLVGDKLVENWRVNLMSSPDGPPANSGNAELVRETGSRREKQAREQKVARVDSTVAPRIEAARPPPRPNIPLEISEEVWKALETSEAYLNYPRQQPIRTRSSYESQWVYTGAKYASMKPRPTKVESATTETTPIGDRCHKAHQTSPHFAMDHYSCGLVHLGSLNDGKPSTVIKSLDQLQGSLFPMRIGARMSFRSQTSMLSDSKYDSTTTSSCEVVSKGSAQELDSRLTGAAWRIRCQAKTIMPNNDNKVDDSSSDDYYLEDMGTQLSMIGKLNWSTKEYVLPKAGAQTVFVTERDNDARLTNTYQYHHFAVGESQIAADSTEWVQQNAEEKHKLAENQRLKTEREQAFARRQQAAQAERAKPANVAPAQASESAGSGLFGALIGEVYKGALGQVASRSRASGTVGGQIAGEFYDQAAAKIGNSASMASAGGNSASAAGAGGNSAAMAGATGGRGTTSAFTDAVGGSSGDAACLKQLAGPWKHPVGGTWRFKGNIAQLVLNSTNYGSAAQQITEIAISSCDNNTMTYKIVRAALINTVDPSMAYDKTPANAPSSPQWSKTHQQAYTISGGALQFGNYSYSRM